MSEDVVLAKIEGLRELFNEKFDNNDETHHQMNFHLKELNGQVAKNSAFRQKGMVIVGILSLIAGSAVTGLVTILITKVFN